MLKPTPNPSKERKYKINGMAKFGKWIGGGIGWAFGGPMGGLFGYALGAIFDKVSGGLAKAEEYKRNTGDFGASLFVLMAAVIKADGKVLQSEINYVNSFLQKQYGPTQAQQHMLVLQQLLKQDFNLEEVCAQIKANTPEATRLQLLHLLFGISAADGEVHASEIKVLGKIAGHIGLKKADYSSIKAMFYKNESSDYEILEIEKTATDAEVKKAYRKMSMKYHPDKLGDIGAEYQKAAKEKFQKVQSAYEAIKKQRGIR
jgi:DnaJ like chaperone protein